MDEQEPEYRIILREAAAKLKTVAERLQEIHFSLSGQAHTAAIGCEWSRLAGVPGVETRIIKDAFLMEARYLPGTASPGIITVPEAVYVLVEAGTFWLADEGHPLEAYTEGMYKYLAPGQPHHWRCEGHVLNLLPFVPATYRPTPNL